MHSRPYVSIYYFPVNNHPTFRKQRTRSVHHSVAAAVANFVLLEPRRLPDSIVIISPYILFRILLGAVNRIVVVVVVFVADTTHEHRNTSPCFFSSRFHKEDDEDVEKRGWSKRGGRTGMRLGLRLPHVLANHYDEHYEDGKQHKNTADRDGYHDVRWRAAYCDPAIARRPTLHVGMKYWFDWRPLALANGLSCSPRRLKPLIDYKRELSWTQFHTATHQKKKYRINILPIKKK